MDLFSQITAGSHAIIPEQELQDRLARGEKLRIKLGMDPTAPDLHLGHAVVLSKLKLFQEYGHEIVFLIGDFTARIGDPSGRSKTRPALSPEEIEHNTKTYFDQVSNILDPSTVTVRYNSEWLSQLSSADMIHICSKVTLARIIEREDFANRIEQRQAIAMHELMYPLLQAYDSVELGADVEIGGTDQTFNLLMGRFLQEQYDQRPQVVLTVPILEGLDGVHKMSKSLGNAIGLTDAPEDAFGKLMSISDDLMWRYYAVLLNTPEDKVAQMKHDVANNTTHPMELKKQMAHAIIARFWSQTAADAALQQFSHLFEQRDYSHAQRFTMPPDAPHPISIIELLKLLEVVESGGQAKRLIKDGAVKIDGEKVTDITRQIHVHEGTIIKAGKHKIFQLHTCA